MKIYLAYSSITYATKAFNILQGQTHAVLAHTPNTLHLNSCSYSVVIDKEYLDLAPRQRLVGAFEQTDIGFSEVVI